jgi:prephenate dehydrogenase
MPILVLIATPVGQMPRNHGASRLISGPILWSPMAAAPNPMSLLRHVPPSVNASGSSCRHTRLPAPRTAALRRPKADLYRERKVVLTPLPENSVLNVARVRSAWEWCGALIHELSPAEHDRVFAAVSHLPHLLSFALVHDLAVRENSDLFFTFAASDSVTSRASPPVIRRCGGISASPIARRCWTSWIAIVRSSMKSAWPLLLAMARVWKKIFDTARTARRAWQELQELQK